MTTPDYRALCAELVEQLQRAISEHGFCLEAEDALMYRARTALAQPEAEGASDEDRIKAAFAMGQTGAPSSETERLAFESWMRGHSWLVQGVWNGTTYDDRGPSRVSSVDVGAMQTRMLWAAWRDRAALTQPEAEKAGDSENGLHGKYIIYKAKTGEPVDYPCFVLRIDGEDPAAITALRVYASCGENVELQKDVCQYLAALPHPEPEGDRLFHWRNLGDGKPIQVQECPMCGIAPANVDDCGRFGDPACPYFGVGKPEPEGPTDEKLMAMFWQGAGLSGAGTGDHTLRGLRAVLARWGRPAVQPVPEVTP
jgi:hypothetical protein